MPYPTANRRSGRTSGGSGRPVHVHGHRSGDNNIETTIGRNVTVLPSGCWAYRGDLTRYGNLDSKAGRIIVHRFVYETLVGPIPDDHHLHHECENPGCCIPAHLVPRSPGDHRRRHAEMRRAS